MAHSHAESSSGHDLEVVHTKAWATIEQAEALSNDKAFRMAYDSLSSVENTTDEQHRVLERRLASVAMSDPRTAAIVGLANDVLCSPFWLKFTRSYPDEIPHEIVIQSRHTSGFSVINNLHETGATSDDAIAYLQARRLADGTIVESVHWPSTLVVRGWYRGNQSIVDRIPLARQVRENYSDDLLEVAKKVNVVGVRLMSGRTRDQLANIATHILRGGNDSGPIYQPKPGQRRPITTVPARILSGAHS